jgi:hypothetical protein
MGALLGLQFQHSAAGLLSSSSPNSNSQEVAITGVERPNFFSCKRPIHLTQKPDGEPSTETIPGAFVLDIISNSSHEIRASVLALMHA